MLLAQELDEQEIRKSPPVCKIKALSAYPADQLIDSDFLMFPNPAKSEVNMAFCLQEACEVRINLISDMGDAFKKELYCDLVMPGTQKLHFDVKDLPQGVYVMVFRIDGMIWYIAELAIDRTEETEPAL